MFFNDTIKLFVWFVTIFDLFVTSTLKRYPQPPFVSEDTSAIMEVISRLTQLLNKKATSVTSNQTNPLLIFIVPKEQNNH